MDVATIKSTPDAMSMTPPTISMTPPLLPNTQPADTNRYPSPTPHIADRTKDEKTSANDKQRSRSTQRNRRSRSKPRHQSRNRSTDRRSDRHGREKHDSTSKSKDRKRSSNENKESVDGDPAKTRTSKQSTNIAKRKSSEKDRSGRNRSRSDRSRERDQPTLSKHSEPNTTPKSAPVATTANPFVEVKHLHIEIRTTRTLPSIQYSENGRFNKSANASSIAQRSNSDTEHRNKPEAINLRRSRTPPPNKVTETDDSNTGRINDSNNIKFDEKKIDTFDIFDDEVETDTTPTFSEVIPISKTPPHGTTQPVAVVSERDENRTKPPDAPVDMLYTEYEQFLFNCEKEAVVSQKKDYQIPESNATADNWKVPPVPVTLDQESAQESTDHNSSSSSSDSSPSSSSSSSSSSSTDSSTDDIQSPHDSFDDSLASISAVPLLGGSWDVSNLSDEEELMSKAAELANTIAKKLGKKVLPKPEKADVTTSSGTDGWDMEPKSRSRSPPSAFERESVPDPETMLLMLQNRPAISMKLNTVSTSITTSSLLRKAFSSKPSNINEEDDPDFTDKLSEKANKVETAQKTSSNVSVEKEDRSRKRSPKRERSKSSHRRNSSSSSSKPKDRHSRSPHRSKTRRSSSSRSKRSTERRSEHSSTSPGSRRSSSSKKNRTSSRKSTSPSASRSAPSVENSSGSRSRRSPKRRSRSPLSLHHRNHSRSPPHKRPRPRATTSQSPPIQRSRSPIRRGGSPLRRISTRTRSPSPNGHPKSQPRTPPHPAPTSPGSSPKRSPIPWPDHYGYNDFHMPESYHGAYHDPHEHYRAGSLSPKRMALDHRIARVLGGYEEEMDPHQHAYGKYHGGHCGPPDMDDESSFVYPDDPLPMHGHQQTFSNLIELTSAMPTPPNSQFALQKGNVLEIVPKIQIPETPVVPAPLSKEEQDKLDALRAEQRQKRKHERDKIRLEKFMRKEKLKLELQSLLDEEMSMIAASNDAALGDDGEKPDDAVESACARAVYNKHATVGKSCLRPEEPTEEGPRKTVLFSDGIRPGDGTSLSDTDDTTPLPLRDRNKKAMKKRLDSRHRRKLSKLKKGKKDKTETLPISSSYGQDQVTKLVIEPELENMPPPPPPPGEPPAHLPQPTLRSALEDETVPRLIYFHYNARDNSMYVSPYPKPQQMKPHHTEDQHHALQPQPTLPPPQPQPLHPPPAALLIRPPPLTALSTSPVLNEHPPAPLAPSIIRRTVTPNRTTGSPLNSPHNIPLANVTPTSTNQYRWPADHTIPSTTTTTWEPIAAPAPSPLFHVRNPPELQPSPNDVKSAQPPPLMSIPIAPPLSIPMHPSYPMPVPNVNGGVLSNTPLLADPPRSHALLTRRRHSVAFNQAPALMPQPRHLVDVRYPNPVVRFGHRAPLIACGEHIGQQPALLVAPPSVRPHSPGVHGPSVGLLSTPILSVQQLQHHQHQLLMFNQQRMPGPEKQSPLAPLQYRHPF